MYACMYRPLERSDTLDTPLELELQVDLSHSTQIRVTELQPSYLLSHFSSPTEVILIEI